MYSSYGCGSSWREPFQQQRKALMNPHDLHSLLTQGKHIALIKPEHAIHVCYLTCYQMAALSQLLKPFLVLQTLWCDGHSENMLRNARTTYSWYLKRLNYGNLQMTPKPIGFQVKKVNCAAFNLLWLCYYESKVYAEIYPGLIKYGGKQEGTDTQFSH